MGLGDVYNWVVSTPSPFADWSTGQLVFGCVWPLLVLWFIMKFVVEKLFHSSRTNAIADLQETRKLGFEDFRTQSDPNKSAVLARIYGADGGTTEQLIELYKEILGLNLQELQDGLQTNKYKAITVMSAFVWRAMKINEQLNCMTQVITEAFKNAERLDTEFFGTNKKKGPLHGLPFSVKSNFNVAGYPVTVGLWKLLDTTKETTCPFVEHLENLGAVPFCLTNVPQGLLSYVSSNPLYGTTSNPWDFNRTPGGSSGGEAALLAAGGAAFGTGSDLAGSLRIPAAFCGLVTLKPTQERLVTTGTHGGLPGRGRLGLSFGFYTRNVEDQEYLLRQIVGSPEYRELCPMSSPAALAPIPLELDQTKQPRIGYFLDDGFHPVAPSQRRAVEETIQRLRARGIECVEFKMADIKMIVKEKKGSKKFGVNDYANMLFRNVMPDNGAYMADDIYADEQYDKHMSRFIWLICLKQFAAVRFFITYLGLPVIRTFMSSRLAVLASARNDGLADARRNQEYTDIFKERWLAYWKSQQIDALICPSFITPAQEFAYPVELSTGAFLTGLFNMLDVPAGVVPVGHVTQQDVEELSVPARFNIAGDSLMEKQMATCKGTEGLPTAVQVVTLPNEEEMCLRVMRIVEKAMKDEVYHLKWRIDDQEAQQNPEAYNFPDLPKKASKEEVASFGRKKSEFYFERVPMELPPRRM